MTRHSTSALSLTKSGFTEDQASALATAIERAAAGAIDDLRHDLESWHVHLAMYLLIQIGIVLLVIMMVQVMRDPVGGALAGLAVDTPVHSLVRSDQVQANTLVSASSRANLNTLR